MKRVLDVFTLILFLSLIFSCNDDNTPVVEVEESLFINEPISICNNYSTHMPEGLDYVNFVKEFNGDLIYGGQSGFQIWDDFGANLLHEEVQSNFFFNEVLVYNNTAILCTSEGVYSYNEQQELSRLTGNFCRDIVLYQDKVLFSSLASVFQLNPEDQTVELFIEPSEETKYYHFGDIAVMGDKLFFANGWNAEIRISEYLGSVFITDYIAEQNIGLETISFPGHSLLANLISNGEDLYYWTENGPSKYLYKKEGERFEEVINTEDLSFTLEPSLQNEFHRVSPSDFAFVDDKLVASSWKGLFEMDLSTTPVGLQLKVDPELPSANIIHRDLSTNPAQASYVVTNLDTVVKISCD